MRNYLTILFLFVTVLVLGQSVTSPVSRTYQINTAGQDASGFNVSGFGSSDVLLASIGIINPPAGTTFSVNTTTGLTFATGYSSWTNITRISFTGTMSNINNALSTLKINTGSSTGNVQISVSATINPTGYYYNSTNAHFYKPITAGAYYLTARSNASATTFKGQTGYLVTITSASEDTFIQSNVPGNNIWFAASDRVTDGTWVIDAGPEQGTVMKTQNGQYNGNIAGVYNNWAPGEPNGSNHSEDYAVTKWGGNQWNDLSNNYNNPYVIEYGTWSNPDSQTFTDFYVANTINQVAITNTLSGTISVPTLSTYPTVSLYKLVSGNYIFVESKSVASNGTYSFTLPSQNTTYKLVPSLSIQSINSTDSNLVYGEVKNTDTPPYTQSGLVMTGTKQWKSADVNKNGIIDLGDYFLISAHISGFKLLSEVLWFSPTDYDSITKNNFNSVNPVSFFTINVTTSNVTQNIKYCILGDVNLSHSSQ